MTTSEIQTNTPLLPLDTVIHGNCVDFMRTRMTANSVDFILTDPPYLVNFRDRSGRRIKNDDNDDWVTPAYVQMARVLKPRSFLVTFYGWSKVGKFSEAWEIAGLRIVGHIVFRKRYASSSRFLHYRHEQAYLLAKGDVQPPSIPIDDVIDMPYSGNALHPTQKPVEPLRRLVETFCPTDGVVLDPFCGSGSTLIAAHGANRPFVGIELDAGHFATASARLRRRQ